jgi:peptidoglycan/LPS O-acetylase OafA/YrhL
LKNWKLELIRGCAALFVFIGHLVMINPRLNTNFLIKFISSWGTEAVIVFFVLSGIVINISYNKNPVSKYDFAISRIKRIYPQYLIGILLTLGLGYLSIIEKDQYHTIWGNMIFLGTIQNYIFPVLKGNPVVWSLTFEMFFYLIFLLSIGSYQKIIIKIFFFFSSLCIVFYYFSFNGYFSHIIAMFAFSTIWMLGYYMVEFMRYFQKPKILTSFFFLALLPGLSRLHFSENYYCVIKYLIFSIASFPFFLFLIKEKSCKVERIKLLDNFGFISIIYLVSFTLIFFVSPSLSVNKSIYIGLPTIIFILLGLDFKFQFNWTAFLNYFPIGKIRKTGFFLGRLSYSIYIVHFPILLFVRHFIKGNWSFLLMGVILTFMVAYFLEYYFQRLFQTKVKYKYLI